MPTTLERYTPSGLIGLEFWPLFAVALVLTGLVAWPYQLLMWWVPITLVKAFAPMILGLLGGAFLARVLRHGACRSRAWAGVAALTLASVAVGVGHVVGYGLWIENAAVNLKDADPSVLARVQTVASYVEHRWASGWTVAGRLEVVGGWVLAIWVFEFLTVLWIVGLERRQAQEPFCEDVTWARPVATTWVPVADDYDPARLTRATDLAGLRAPKAGRAGGPEEGAPQAHIRYDLMSAAASSVAFVRVQWIPAEPSGGAPGELVPWTEVATTDLPRIADWVR